jgi:hypothetical protein
MKRFTFDEGVVDALVHVHALDAAAALARVVEGAVGDGGGSPRDVHVVRDVDGVLAAELELRLQHPRARDGRDPLARRVGAGEEDRVDGGVKQRGAHVARADHGLEDVAGNARLAQRLGDGEPRERGDLAGLVQDGVPGQERRHEDVRAHEVGIVPRAHVGDDAQRLARDDLPQPRLAMDLLVGEDARRGVEEEADAALRRVELAARLRDGLAHFEGERARELLAAARENVAESADRREPLVEAAIRPSGLRLARGRRLRGDGARVVRGHATQERAVRGIGHVKHGGPPRRRCARSRRA